MIYQRALRGREKELGPDHTLTLQTVNGLGNLYKDQDRLGEAEAMYQRALSEQMALGASYWKSGLTLRNIQQIRLDPSAEGAGTFLDPQLPSSLRGTVPGLFS